MEWHRISTLRPPVFRALLCYWAENPPKGICLAGTVRTAFWDGHNFISIEGFGLVEPPTHWLLILGPDLESAGDLPMVA